VQADINVLVEYARYDGQWPVAADPLVCKQSEHTVYYGTEFSLLGCTFYFQGLTFWKYYGKLFQEGVNGKYQYCRNQELK
jgi:hypothetical protein